MDRLSEASGEKDFTNFRGDYFRTADVLILPREREEGRVGGGASRQKARQRTALLRGRARKRKVSLTPDLRIWVKAPGPPVSGLRYLPSVFHAQEEENGLAPPPEM